MNIFFVVDIPYVTTLNSNIVASNPVIFTKLLSGVAEQFTDMGISCTQKNLNSSLSEESIDGITKDNKKF
jgi:hypothetical protein